MKKQYILPVAVIVLLIVAFAYFTTISAGEWKFPKQAFEAEYKWERYSDPPDAEDRAAILTIRGDGAGRVRFEWSDRPSEYQVENFVTRDHFVVMPDKKEYHATRNRDVSAVMEFYLADFLRRYTVDITGAQHMGRTRVDGYRIIGERINGITVNLLERRNNDYWFDQSNQFLVKSQDTLEKNTDKGRTFSTTTADLRSLKFAKQDPSWFEIPAGYAQK